jgi:hypothetical protein
MLLDRISGPPQDRNEWSSPSRNKDQVEELLEKIAELRKDGVTGAFVVFS